VICCVTSAQTTNQQVLGALKRPFISSYQLLAVFLAYIDASVRLLVGSSRPKLPPELLPHPLLVVSQEKF
jgi:hypothetical protein